MPKPQFTCAQIVAAVIAAGGSRVQAARDLGINVSTVFKYVKRAEAMGLEVPAASHNPASAARLIENTEAAHHAAPEHYHVKGVSTLVDAEGNVKQQWIKTDQDAEERFRMFQAAAAALAAEQPRQEPMHVPESCIERLCNLYTITDFHVGMLAWRREGGADWDLQIAERVLIDAFRRLISNSPRAKVCVIAQLGDFLHTDGFQPVTPASKHVLDADSRFPKIVEVAVRALRAVVNAGLERHERVHVLMAEGNHDPASSVWLRVLFRALYENEPRVTVEDSPLPYYAYQHGKTMLAFHHGHLSKKAKLHGVFPAQFPKMWGATDYRYGHTGHLHHADEKEDGGITITQHPTLAARDAYASRGAWFAARAAQSITYDSEFGQVARNIVTPEMIL
jgi:transposase-like protein